MSEIEERFISTPQQELEYQKRKNSELLSYAEKNHKLIEELMARAEKAEAALESAQKMCDHWEVKAGNWKFRAEKAEAERDELKRKLSDSEGEKLDLVKPAPVDWGRVRIESAMLILRLLPSNSVGDGIIEEVTKGAVKWANALVAELNKEVQG